MIRILIVDDEHTIRKGLEKSIPWKEHGFTIAGTAKNGIDALDFFQNNYADIILSDIKMPRMNGLELQQHIHEKYPNLPFIFISGYEDFNYARQALRCGAFSYLLKPIDPEELLSEVKRACEQYQLTRENAPLKQIIERNFYGLEKHWDFTDYEYLQSDCEHNYFCVMNIRCHMDDMRSQIFLLAFQTKLQALVLECFSNQNSALIEASSRGIIFCVMDANVDNLKYAINNFVNTISERLTDYAATPLGVWTGGVYRGISRLIDSYVESFENNSFRYFNEAKENSKTLSFDTYSLLFDCEDDIIAALYKGQIEEAIQILDEQRLFLLEKNLSADDARLYLRHLLHKYIRGIKSANPSIELPDGVASYGIFSLLTISEMFTKLYDLLHLIANIVKPVTINHGSQIMDKVKEYIGANFSDPYLSLSIIADHVGLNASYLSAEFTKKEKTGLSNYITDIRMEKAKKLLATSDMTVADICIATGYLNPTYFSTTFKKFTGFTPSQYRKSLD